MSSGKMGDGRPSKIIGLVQEQDEVDLVIRRPVFRQRVGVVLSPEEHVGSLVIPQRRGEGEDYHDVDWHVVPGVFEALGLTQQILLRYGIDLGLGERSRMLDVMRRARALNISVLTGSRDPKSVARLREGTQKDIRAAARHFGEPKRASKREALEFLAKIEAGLDLPPGKRLNPTPVMARTIAVVERARRRLEQEMNVYSPYVLARQEAILQLIRLTKFWLDVLDQYLVKLLAYDGLRPLCTEEGRLVNQEQLTFFCIELGRIDFNPFRVTAQETVRDLRFCRGLLNGPVTAETLRQIRIALLNCRAAIAMKARQIEIERVVYAMNRALRWPGSRFDVGRTVANLRAIETQLAMIDDRHLREPSCGLALEQLTTAITHLEGGKIALPAIVERLRGASAAL